MTAYEELTYSLCKLISTCIYAFITNMRGVYLVLLVKKDLLLMVQLNLTTLTNIIAHKWQLEWKH